MQEVFEKIIEELGALKNALTEKYHEARDGENSLECIFDAADILDERASGVVDALKIVRQFAAEYNNGWIPCSERLTELLGYWNHSLPEKVDYADLICAPAFARGHRMVYEDEYGYMVEDTIKALEELQQYKDTGLTSEQIREIDKLYQEKCEEINKLKAESLTGLEMAEIYATLSHYKQAKEQMNETEKAKSINKLINDSDINTEFLHNWQIDFIRELCERQIPKKPMLMQLAEPEYMCECGMKYWRKGGVKYCIECGQKLDWSVDE